MDLRQFTSTPSNNFDQDQRRTSISSMSSAQSGYASSAYGGAQGNQTPSNPRFNQAHYYGQANNLHHQHSGIQQQHQHQHAPMQQQHPQQHQSHQVQHAVNGGATNQANTNAQNTNWLQHSGLNVAPWIEQQAQVTNSTTSIENQNFINSYGNNLNGPQQGNYMSQQQHQQPQQQHLSAQQLGISQSMQASFDSQSTRVSPSSSGLLPSENNNSNTMMTGKNLNSMNSVNMGTSSSKSPSVLADDDKNDANDSNDNDEHDIDDELIPTAIVIKNIPFAIKKEQLLDVMTKLNLPLPYAFNYHFDNGVFRGLAFANFTSTDETTSVVTQLNGREIGGRKLRVEYKKMLPLVERERIEREKREKRGQLEEQHRSTSNASLASMISIASAPSGSKPLVGSTQQLTPGVVEQPLQPQQNSAERYYAQTPSVINLPSLPSQVDFNDPETLEFYSQLLFFRDDRDKVYNELAYPANLSQTHKRIVSILAQFLGLVEFFDNNFILIKRRNVIHDPSPILRSHSHSAIPLLNQQQSSSQQRFRQQQNTVPQQGPGRIPANFSIGMQAANNGLSSAALLRNNPTPTRVPPMYNQGSNTQAYFQQQPQQMPPQQGSSQQLPTSQSQPGTPGLDATRFNTQQGQWDEQYANGQNANANVRQDQDLNDGLNNLNLGLDNGSNIWGPRSVQPAV